MLTSAADGRQLGETLSDDVWEMPPPTTSPLCFLNLENGQKNGDDARGEMAHNQAASPTNSRQRKKDKTRQTRRVVKQATRQPRVHTIRYSLVTGRHTYSTRVDTPNFRPPLQPLAAHLPSSGVRRATGSHLFAAFCTIASISAGLCRPPLWKLHFSYRAIRSCTEC
ncbi:hypothetical protein BU24DRAFT_221912 [Aaosphaeria arxii CBS 175.79]|uniref:Uncharacterized protein n=1 Tax=Aaosphaeria arxii CBS 175.79 TaxID=1450172 RepID=A0A6A5XNF6_9PLEO|nr:uncharacterized protein BU24DRAFT_221912 [Aaosphaeria arxii CBS 175.79]KAF2014795.1 hypothetical protein BU24DRAFT_221912 [Aaosphaeria arxii CBS 175.79]